MKNKIFDTIIKQLFHVSPKALIDLLNAIYQDKISYDAGIDYGNNEFTKSNLDDLRGYMFLNIDEKGQIRRFHTEFQTLNDKTMILRMFEYGYQKAIELIKDYQKEIRVKFPEQRLIFLEKNENIPDEIEMVLELNDGKRINYKVPTIKYGEYGILELCKRNLYVLLPLYVIKLRREFENINRSAARTKEEKTKLTKEKFDDLLRTVYKMLEAMKELLENEKITLEDCNIMSTAMTGLSDYLYEKYDKYKGIDEEVKRMVKTFIDPVVMEKGKIEGKIEAILELLEDHGPINEGLRERITGETQMATLKKWLKLAANVSSIDEFVERMSNC